MSNTLPPAIADLCGILTGEPRTTYIQPSKDFDATNPVNLIEDSDGCWTLVYDNDVVGWINKVGIMNRDDYKFRAVSKHGEVKLCHSLNHAKGWLLEEYA